MNTPDIDKYSDIDKYKAKFALNVQKIHFMNLIVVITGQWSLTTYAMKLRIPHNCCRSCNEQEEIAVGNLRRKILEHSVYIDRTYLTKGDLNKIQTFVKLSG